MFRTSVRAAVAALASLLLLASGGLIATGAAADVVPGSSVDLTVVTAGPTAGQHSGAFTYTVTISNNSLPDADGASFTITNPVGATGVTATCSASAGATCGSLTPSDASIAGSVGDLPQNGIVTITIEGFYPASGTSVTTSATVTPPSGVTELLPETNESAVSTSLTQDWDFAVVKTASQSTIAPGDTVRYTLTYTNVGASNNVPLQISDVLQFTNAAEYIFSGFTADFVGCTPTAGGMCPTTLADSTGDSTGYSAVYDGPMIPAGVPTGGAIEIVYDVTFVGPNAPACGSATSGGILNIGRVTGDQYTANNSYNVYATTPGQQPCAQVGGAGSNKSQSRDQMGLSGELLENTYTITFSNDGDEALEAVNIRDVIQSLDAATGLYSGFTAEFISCVSTGGVACPAFSDIETPRGFPGILFDHRVEMPARSTLTVVYTVTLITYDEPACGDLTAGIIRNTAYTHLPLASTDGNPSNNQSSVDATTPDLEGCPEVDLETTKTQSTSLIEPGETIRYTVTHRNNGPEAVPAGFQIRDSLSSEGFGYFGTPEATIVSCVSSEGECPELNTSLAFVGLIYTAEIEEEMPAGATITIVYDMTVDLAATPQCQASQIGFRNSAGFTNTIGQDYGPIEGVADSNLANDKAVVIAAHACTDVAVNKTVSSQITQGGAPLAYTISVTNAGPAVAPLVHVSDPLPTAFVFGDVTCAATGSAVCPTASYDPTTLELTADILNLADGDEVIFTINGVAAALPGTYSNTATVSSVEGDQYYYDPNLESDASTVNFQINNTTSSLSVTKVITGGPDAGLPADSTFGGEVACGTQVPQRWQVTIPAGMRTGTATPLTFYDGESCTVTEDTQSVPPPGYEWDDVIISPSTLTLTDDATVTVTNVLGLLPVGPTSQVVVTKIIDGGPVDGLPEDSTFGGTVTCAGVAEQWEVTIPAGDLTGSALPVSFATGAECVITETSQSAPPEGYTWTSVEISPEQFTLVGDTQASVTNVLTADLPTEPEPDSAPAPGTAGPGGLAFTGSAVGGILWASLALLALGGAVLLSARMRRA